MTAALKKSTEHDAQTPTAAESGPMKFASRLDCIETSQIRELFKLLKNPEIISLGGGFPDSSLFDLEGLRAAADKALSDREAADSLQYGATEGYMPLRTELARYMASKSCEVSPDDLIVTSGSQQAIDLVAKCLINPGDKVIVEAPTFLASIQCLRLYGAELINAPIDADGVQVDVLEALICEHRPKLIYLIPSFSNPSGASLSVARRLRLLELARKYQVVVLEDDPYSDLYFDNAPPPSLLMLAPRVPGSRAWLAYAGSLSKVLAPGLRLGWLVAEPALLAKAAMCKQFSDVHTSNLGQVVAAKYLQSGRMEANVAHMRAVYRARAAAMARALAEHLGDQFVFEQPSGGLFFWGRLEGPNMDAGAFALEAIAHLVAFVPGSPFFASDPDRRYLRLSFASADEAKIQLAISRLGVALCAYRAAQASRAQKI